MDSITKKIIGVSFLIFFLGIVFGGFFFSSDIDHSDHSMMSMDEMRSDFIALKNDMQHDLLPQSLYRCCLEKPCTYCIEKTPGHGEGATCSCLEDLVNGVHPCGECIGEILEGHGNPLLAEYFARAIAEKVGEDHIDTIKEIIEEKYDFPIEDQL